MENEAGSFSIFPGSANFIDLTLIQFGWEQCKPLYAFGPYIRNNYLFHYVLSGTGYVEYHSPEQGARRFQVESGSGFLICPDQITTYCADEKHPWKYEWIEFGGIQAEYQLLQAGLKQDTPIYTPKSPEAAALVETEFQNIVGHPEASPVNLIGHLYLLLAGLVSSSQSQIKVRAQSQNSYYINQAVQYIQRHYTENITSDDIAVFCGLSRTHLGRIFKKITGQTLQKYLTAYRMSKAIELMRSTELSLGEIAPRVGYSSQLYFSKVFHQYYGLPPSVWRQLDTEALAPPNPDEKK